MRVLPLAEKDLAILQDSYAEPDKRPFFHEE
jgi:hypothetical protein